MRLIIDTDSKKLITETNEGQSTFDLYSPEAFDLLNRQWLNVGWGGKFSYSFSWLGRPIIQLPTDLIRLQEAIWKIQPDIIIETGIAHGGSAVFCAGLCELIGKGRVIAVDIEIREHNRKAIESHSLAHKITLLEGDSISNRIINEVRNQVSDNQIVFVMLDSNHTYDHVKAELEVYGPLVSIGSYIVATDGVMQYLADVPGGESKWSDDHPSRAAVDFVKENTGFVIEPMPRPFDESLLPTDPTYWPSAWIKRIG